MKILKIIKKTTTNILLLCLLLMVSPQVIFASNEVNVYETAFQNDEAISPRGNITGYIYKIYNGRQWKRLWSYTYNKWVDPEWTLA